MVHIIFTSTGIKLYSFDGKNVLGSLQAFLGAKIIKKKEKTSDPQCEGLIEISCNFSILQHTYSSNFVDNRIIIKIKLTFK